MVAATLVLAWLAALATGCSDDDGASPRPSTSTSAQGLGGQIVQRTLSHGGESRTYGVFRPDGAAADAAIVVVLHALFNGQESSEPIQELVRSAVTDGFITVVPVGLGFSWNAGSCCGAARDAKADDVGFVQAVVADVVRRDGGAAAKVSIVGFYNGGMLAYRIACERPALARSVAVIEATLAIDRCGGGTLPDLLVIHQTGDELVPYAGTTTSDLTTDGVLRGTEDALRIFTRAAGCSRESEAATADRVTTTSYRCPHERRAQLVRVEGGGHDWPAPPSAPVSASTLALDYFGLEAAP